MSWSTAQVRSLPFRREENCGKKRREDGLGASDRNTPKICNRMDYVIDERMRRRWFSGAGAVDAAVFGAGAADFGELLFEGLAGAMNTDGGVACGDSRFFCEGLEARFSQIDTAEDFAIGGLHGLDGFGDALADDIVGLRVWCRFGGEILAPTLKSAIFGGAVAIVVDDGVAEDAVEPGDHGLFAAECGGLLDGAGVSGLDDVLGGVGGVDAPLHEVKELFALEDQVGDCRRLHGCGFSVRGGEEGSSAPPATGYLDAEQVQPVHVQTTQVHSGPQGHTQRLVILILLWSGC
jgi:hypothetical protein